MGWGWNEKKNVMIEDKYRYKALDVAKYIVVLLNDRGMDISLTKIEKLMYLSYGLNLALDNTRLTDEHPRTNSYGPCFPETNTELLKLNLADRFFSGFELDTLIIAKEKCVSINEAVRYFGYWSENVLCDFSRMPGTPWYFTTKFSHFEWGDIIPDELIRDFFKTHFL